MSGTISKLRFRRDAPKILTFETTVYEEWTKINEKKCVKLVPSYTKIIKYGY